MPSIFIKDAVSNIEYVNLFQSNNFEINDDENVKSNYVFYSESNLNLVYNYCQKFNISNTPQKLLDKFTITELFKKYNFKTTECIIPKTRADLESLDDVKKYIIKPKKSYGMRLLDRSPVSQLSYKPLSKSALLELIDFDATFWNKQETDDIFVIQDYVDYVDTNNKQTFLILYGAINGAGDCYNANPALSSRSYNHRRFESLNIWAAENNNSKIIDCQNKINDLLYNEGIRNVFYNFQLLYDGDDFVPLDLQYRLGYNEIALYQQITHTQYTTDLLNFTYDISTVKPTQPFVIGLQFNERDRLKKYTTGTTKQEVLDLINNE